MKHITRLLLHLLVATAMALFVGCGGKEEEQLGSIAGFVVDANTGEPVRAANITLSPEGSSAISGSDGRYEFQGLKAGTYTVQVTKSGYMTNTKTVVVPAGGVGAGDIMLTPSSGDMSLSVSYVDFGTSLTVETFQIINNASTGSFQWSIVKESPADWLTVSPTSGSCGAGQHSPVTLTVNRQLVTTSQTVNVRVTNTTSGNSITLPVSVSYANGTLQVTPNPVDFGTSASSRQMTIHNSGATSVTYEINYSCVWLAVSPTGGTIPSNSNATIALSLDRSAFTGAAQTILQVRNTADGSIVNVTVTATNEGGGNTGSIVVPGGLQCYYTFNNGTPNDLTDNGIDAQFMNSATTATDGSRTYLKLNMITGDYLNIPYNLFQGLSNWSVSFWIKDFGAGCLFAAQRSDQSSGWYDEPILWATQDNKLKLKLKNGDLENSAGTTFSYNYTNNQADGSWHHVVVTNAGGNAKLYVDGSLRDQVTCEVYQSGINACTKIAFGGNKDGGYDYGSSMKLDNIRIYNRSISSTDVQTIYNNEL